MADFVIFGKMADFEWSEVWNDVDDPYFLIFPVWGIVWSVTYQNVSKLIQWIFLQLRFENGPFRNFEVHFLGHGQGQGHESSEF